MASSPEFIKRKVALLGDGAVGKTSLVRRFTVDKFSDDYITTIGAKVMKKDVRVNFGLNVFDVSMVIWDILGQKEFRNIQDKAFHGSSGVIIVFDLNRPETRESVMDYWVPRVKAITGPVSMVLFGNKLDLVKDRTDVENEVKHLANELECPYYLTSAKTGENVDIGFHSLAKLLIPSKVIEVKSASERAELLTEKGISGVTDLIMIDFCNDFGGIEVGTPVLKKQFDNAGLDINRPTMDGLYKVVDLLADVEKSFKSEVEVDKSRSKRLDWIKSIRKS